MELIDVDDLLSRYSLTELIETAESYFQQIVDPEYHLVKPLFHPPETAVMLSHFAAMTSALDLRQRHRLLDFGCGTCWTTRLFLQMGLDVVGTDVSKSALQLGRLLFDKLPVLGTRGTVELRLFDGVKIDAPSESFDRIAVMDAFHHVPNWAEVLREFHRVLIPGGRVVMVEPGPNHSRTEQSQHEMRNFSVIERDIDINQIETLAESAGFGDISVGIYAGIPHFVSVRRFDEELEHGASPRQAAQHFLENHRLIQLNKIGRGSVTSRTGKLSAKVAVNQCGPRRLVVQVTNNSETTWLGEGCDRGTVNLGAHLLNREGKIIEWDYLRHKLRADGRSVEPGETVEIELDLGESILPGERLQLDLVAESIAWFAEHGSAVVELRVDS